MSREDALEIWVPVAAYTLSLSALMLAKSVFMMPTKTLILVLISSLRREEALCTAS